MSMFLMVKAMQTKVGNPLRKLVLIKLADNANDQGECWPSYQYIADQCEISKRSVISHINSLCESGLLTKISRDGTLKGNSSNLYRLTLSGELISPPSANAAPPSESLAPPPSANAAPRISHSFEPVNEPLKDLVSNVENVLRPEEQSGYFLALKDGTTYEPPASQIIKWSQLYTMVDVISELKSMIGWLDANPTKRKTRSGIKRFCNSWLSRSNENAKNKPKQQDWDAAFRDTSWADDMDAF